ncbi:hypothetical protein JXO59_03195, partial [candidate division KSB1 bacterium]|nr:hypothetical protein [candidate division KSB1 bacterium]
DAFMVHGSALFTRNIYLKYINPQAGDQELLKTARYASCVIVLGGLFFAYAFPSVVHGLMEVWKVTAYLGIAFWAGVIWKKANRYGALVSALAMAAIAVYTGNVLKWPMQDQIALYVPVGMVLMIVVSYFTRPEPEDQLRKFYTLLDTPVGREQRLKDQNIPIMLEGQSQGRPAKKYKERWIEKLLGKGDDEDGLLIVDLLSLRRRFSWARYRVDIIGFLAASTIVLFLIVLALYLARLGA